jgi:hypothetical protein
VSNYYNITSLEIAISPKKANTKSLKFVDAKGKTVSITAMIQWYDKDLHDEDND